MNRPAIAMVALIFACQPVRSPPLTADKIYALKYAESNYPARLVNTRQKSGTVRMNWLAYLIQSHDGSLILVDCGFSNPTLVKRFKLQKFRQVTVLLGDLGVSADAITHVVLTHTHFDHALDVDRFTRATVYVHAEEARKPQDARMPPKLKQLMAEQRLVTVGAEMVLKRDWIIRPVGGHTEGSLALWSTTPGIADVFTGDECYFATECRDKIPLPAAAAYAPQKNSDFINSLPAGIRIFAGHERALTGGSWVKPQVFLFE